MKRAGDLHAGDHIVVVVRADGKNELRQARVIAVVRQGDAGVNVVMETMPGSRLAQVMAENATVYETIGEAHEDWGTLAADARIRHAPSTWSGRGKLQGSR